MAKGFQIGAIPTFSFTITQDIEDGDNKTTSLYGGLALLFRYIFDLRSIVFPFVGSRMGAYGGEVKSEGSGWLDVSYDITILNIGPHAGIKLVMGKLIVTVFFEYMFNSMKIEDMDDWNEYHTIKFGFELGGWIL